MINHKVEGKTYDISVEESSMKKQGNKCNENKGKIQFSKMESKKFGQIRKSEIIEDTYNQVKSISS